MYASALPRHSLRSCRMTFPSVVAASLETALSSAAGPDDVYAEKHHRIRRAVREPGAARYEAEGSERRTLGSISVAPDAHWAATLTVPIPGERVVFIHVERHGPLPADYSGSEEAAAFSVPVAEVEALLAVLTEVTAHARRDGVLPALPR
jgi:hypothetical protein